MPATDSYDILAASIERALRSGIPVGTDDGLPEAIQRALLEEARRGELSIAAFRIPVVLVSGALAAIIAASPSRSTTPWLGEAALAAAWALCAIGLLVALRRGWYRLWLRYAVPIGDTALAAGIIAFAIRSASLGAIDAAAAFGIAIALAAFLASSGGPRLSRTSAQLSSALAMTIVLVASLALHVDLPIALSTVALIGTTGFLVGRAPTLIRRVVTHRIGQMAMTERYEEAQQAVAAREEVLKIVSHDLRNPLSTIAMAASLMLDEEL